MPHPRSLSHRPGLRPARSAWRGGAALGLGALLIACGCDNSMQRIDRDVEALMLETNADMGGDVRTPLVSSWNLDEAENRVPTEYPPTAETLPTVNPAATELTFIPTPADDAQGVINRLDRYNEPVQDATRMDLRQAFAYAIRNSREYRFAEEEFVLTALRLLIERHQWGPRFFDDISATIDGDADDGLYDTSLRLVNEFRITQRLPYGGTVSARALADATEDLHQFVAGEGDNSADIILDADIPLLRGAGTVARDSRIQAERNMIYSAREFERFRREFLVEIAVDFLDLAFQKRSIANSERSLVGNELNEKRQSELYGAGRITRFDAALAENSTVQARQNLNNSREGYRLAVDRFKVRIGMPVEQPLEIVESGLRLPIPAINIDEAVRLAMTYRLDLQNERDQLADSKRDVDNARNDLLPDLDFSGSVSIPTDPDHNDGDFRFSGNDLNFSAGITFGLPLDREIERLNLRQSQINLERSRRSYEQFRDNVATDVRASVRGIDAARFNLQIQQRGVEIAQQGYDAIQAAPERYDSRDNTDSLDDLLAAQDDGDRALRDLEISILDYLLTTGQLRVDSDGSVLLLNGMELTVDESEAQDQPGGTAPAPPPAPTPAPGGNPDNPAPAAAPNPGGGALGEH